MVMVDLAALSVLLVGGFGDQNGLEPYGNIDGYTVVSLTAIIDMVALQVVIGIFLHNGAG